MTCSTSGALLRMSATDADRSCDTTMTRARESATIRPTSRPGSNGLVSTGTAPMRMAPRNVATNSGVSSMTMATRSSGATP